MCVRLALGARGFYMGGSRFESGAAHTLVRWRKRSDSPGSHPGVCGFESRADHKYSTRPRRSWVRIRGFQPREQSSSLCGATKAAVRQDRYEDGKARHSRSGVVQSVGRCPVKAAIWVRIPVPEPWWRSSAGRSTRLSPGRLRVRIPSSPLHCHAPVVKRRSCRITDPAVGVRVPPGALHARLAQWESARFTPARRIGSIPSPSTVAVAQPGRAPGCDPGGCAFEPRRSPHARVAQ